MTASLWLVLCASGAWAGEAPSGWFTRTWQSDAGVTEYSDAKRIFEVLRAGATGYLLKRSTREELLAAIAEIAHGGSPMSSSIARMIAQSFHCPPTLASGMDKLAPREQQVLELLSQGFAHKEIASEMSINIPTLGTYIRRIYHKLHVYTHAQAVAKFQNR